MEWVAQTYVLIITSSMQLARTVHSHWAINCFDNECALLGSFFPKPPNQEEHMALLTGLHCPSSPFNASPHFLSQSFMTSTVNNSLRITLPSLPVYFILFFTITHELKEQKENWGGE